MQQRREDEDRCVCVFYMLKQCRGLERQPEWQLYVKMCFCSLNGRNESCHADVCFLYLSRFIQFLMHISSKWASLRLRGSRAGVTCSFYFRVLMVIGLIGWRGLTYIRSRRSPALLTWAWTLCWCSSNVPPLPFLDADAGTKSILNLLVRNS